MAKIWDDAMKRAFAARPQDFVDWLLPGASLVGKVSLELKTVTRTITADTLYKVTIEGQNALLHVEFQKRPRENMGLRVWEYNVLATLEHNCPVYSYVIYLQPGGDIVQSPLVWGLSGREIVHMFHFWNIKLWEMPIDVLRRDNALGLLPLCLLTIEGKQHQIAEEVFASLAPEKDLLALALTFASMVFVDESDKVWLERKVAMLDDIIRDTWFYQKIWREGCEKGLEEGLEEGLEKGRAEGRMEGMRQIILDTVQERFPALVDFAQQQLQPVNDLARLRQLHSRLVVATSVEDAMSSLADVAKNLEH